QLRVRASYEAEVAATELRLTRPSPQSEEWLIDPDWVEANSPPGPASVPENIGIMGLLFYLAVIVGIVTCVIPLILSLVALVTAFSSLRWLPRCLAIVGMAGGSAGLLIFGYLWVRYGNWPPFALALLGAAAGVFFGIVALVISARQRA